MEIIYCFLRILLSVLVKVREVGELKYAYVSFVLPHCVIAIIPTILYLYFYAHVLMGIQFRKLKEVKDVYLHAYLYLMSSISQK